MASLVVILALFVIFRAIAVFLQHRGRRKHYRNDYLNSKEWKIKRALVLRRDSFRCRFCGKPAHQVHHLRYAKHIGKEPIQWLVSVCSDCHLKQHHRG